MKVTHTPKMKITHLLHTVAYGGVETVLINWLVHAPKSELDIQLVVFENPQNTENAFIEQAEAAGLSVKKIPWSRSKPIFKSARALDRLIIEHNTQILHTHNAYAEMVGLISGKRLGLKLVSTIYVWAGKDFGVKRYLLQKLGASIIKRFDLLTVQCEKARNESANWGFDKDNVIVLPSGYLLPPLSKISTEEIRTIRERFTNDANTVIVCNVARLYPEKGQARMLKIWRRIVDQCPNTVLWIFGVGPLQDELEQLARKLELDDSVVFKGFASNLMDELELCDVQLHTSFNEGVPIAICAGMATGLPIVSTAVGGIPEVIKDRVTGILVDVKDEYAIEEKTIELIRNPSLRKSLGDGAKSFIENEYSMGAAVTTLVNTYQNLLR